MNTKVYLAGPITGLTYDDSEDWRQKARGLLPDWIHTASPLRGKHYLRDHGELPPIVTKTKKCLSTNKGIWSRDNYDVRTSALVLMNLLGAKRISIGSMIEIGWANGAGTPIVLCLEPGNMHEHGMVLEAAGWIVPTLEEGCEVVKWILEPCQPGGEQ